MNAVNGAFVSVTNINPESEESEVGYCEERVERGKMSLTGGEKVFGTVGFEIVGFGVDLHGDGGFRCAISEEEAVFVGGGDRIRVVEGGERRRREVAECEEMNDVVRIEDAEGRVLLDLHEDLEERFFVEEEEAEARGFRLDGG